MKAGRELDAKIGKEIFELSDDAIHCWPTSETEANNALMNGGLHTPFILHSDDVDDWWECNRLGCGNRVVDGQELPICFASVKMWSTDDAAAMEVVRILQQLGFIVRLSSPNHDSSWASKGDWECAFWKRIDMRTGEDDPNMDAPFQHSKEVIGKAIAEALPLAISLAALKAKGIDV